MMTTTTMDSSPQASHGEGHDYPNTGENTVFGFWLYLMTDLILFGSLFIAYVVLHRNIVEGPSGYEIFRLGFVFVETLLLLSSSAAFGFAMLALARRRLPGVRLWLIVTFALGAAFLAMELYEFHHLVAEGYGPSRSAFLSGFFTLVGTHGLHVTVGLVWIVMMLIQTARWGITGKTTVRLTCLSLFWHFLDIVWICVFTVVYLIGKTPA